MNFLNFSKHALQTVKRLSGPLRFFHEHDAERGKESFLRAYGAVNEAEFFTVATEQFFDQPRSMIENAPDLYLYRVLKEYYRQDPASRLGQNS